MFDRKGDLYIGRMKIKNPAHPSFGGARKVDCPRPALPVRPRNAKNKKVVFEGVEAMPVEEEVEEEQNPAAEPPDLVVEEPDLEAAEEDLTCQECVEPRILPDPGQPTQKQLEDYRIDHFPYRSWCPECVAGRATGE